MDDSLSGDELEKLYREFKDALIKGEDISHYTVDDFLDLFDYSHGQADEYVAQESLTRGLKSFPGDEGLVRRQVFFYHDMGHDDIADRIADSLPDHSLVKVFSRSRLNIGGLADNIPDLLSGIRPESLEDGELLYIADVVTAGGYVWILRKYADVLSGLCQYPSTVYHELFRLSLESGNTESAQEYAEKLTSIEPFNAGYWFDIAQFYLERLGKPEAAIDAIEYALAINPESHKALNLKTRILACQNPLLAADFMSSADVPKDEDSLLTKAIVYFRLNVPDVAYGFVEEAIYASFNSRKEIFDLLFENISGELPARFVDPLVTYVASSVPLDVMAWIGDLCSNCRYGGAVAVYDAAASVGMIDRSDSMVRITYCEALFRLGLYDKIIRDMETAGDAGQTSAVLTMIYALSLLKAGRKEDCRKVVERRLHLSGSDGDEKSAELLSPSIISHLADEGALLRLMQLYLYLCGEEIEEKSYNPFC